jgi:HAD domain in Swiss Army Knife RNA repair proteins
MTDLAGYVLETRRLGSEYILYRGRHAAGNAAPILVLAPAAAQQSPANLERLEHEYALASELDPEWAVQPSVLARRDGRRVLVFEAARQAIGNIGVSAHCDSFGFEYARGQLVPSLRKRVCGSTYETNSLMAWRFARRTRYDRILGDVNRRRPDRWLALDDDAFGWPQKELGHLVLVPGECGLRSDLARSELKARLAVRFQDLSPNVKPK